LKIKRYLVELERTESDVVTEKAKGIYLNRLN
jgi:hypothetical protein